MSAIDAITDADAAQLRARLAAAEAVIAALPRCVECGANATSVQYEYIYDEDGNRVRVVCGHVCDDHYPDDPLPYAAQLRAYLALTEGK